jgi:hypothetical protein
MKRKLNLISWVCAVIAGLIMLQTLYFKFSGAAESVYIFTAMGMEPWGRWLTGLMEFIASTLLLIPSKRGSGAVLGAGIMAGAILSHLTVLGIVVHDDGGQLFIYAIITFTACIINVWLHRRQIPIIGNLI